MQPPVLCPVALIAACFLSIAACKEGETASGTDASTTATDGGTASAPTTEDSTGGPTGEPTGEPGPTGDPTDTPTGDPVDPPDGPHALATIVLGETHPSGGGLITPSVSASFIPDVDGAGGGAGGACTMTVAGCQIPRVPDCGACDPDQYCGFDADCNSTCLALCNAMCAPDEACYFPSPGSPGCKKIEAFDAGVLTFFGTPIAITLFPPYKFMSDDNAAPFAPGGMASVQASGATNAGFEKFEHAFTGTDFVQTNPTLDKLGHGAVFGDGPVPIQWIPGNGELTITATVTSVDFKTGTVTCEADDPSGSFDLPREALKAAVDGGELSSLSLAVQRKRVDLYKDLTTKGQLTGVTVQPVGHLQITTLSSEVHTFQGCAANEAACNDACVDVQANDDNCGYCGKVCEGDDTCVSGICKGFTECYYCDQETKTGACKAQNDACAADQACNDLENCYNLCVTQECADSCFQNAPPGAVALYNTQYDCLCMACMAQCSGNYCA